MRRAIHLRGAALVAISIAAAVLVLVGLVAAAPSDARQRCTHGVSSIGPVVIENGKVVGGDTTPHTEACLP